ncbi:MAG: hypothetical protein ABIP79_05965 [Chitinophagaceae bacterium]
MQVDAAKCYNIPRTINEQQEKLNEVSKWVEQYQDFWNKKLDAIENYLNVIQTKKSKYGKPQHQQTLIEKSSSSGYYQHLKH